MRKSSCVGLICMAVMFCPVFAGTELLVNGEFEYPLDSVGRLAGWAHSGAVQLRAETGERAGQFVLSMTGAGEAHQDFNALSGVSYVIRGKVKQLGGDNAASASVNIEFRDASGVIKTVDAVELLGSDPVGQWKSFDYAVAAPPGTTTGRVYLRTSGAADGPVLFDSLSLMAAQTLEWSDEFDGTSLDLNKWIVINAEDWSDCWYAPHNVEVAGGSLILHSAEENYAGKHWTGAKLEGKYHPQYKYLEARLRHSAPDTKIWATWWTIGWQNNTWQWPPELDICEFGTQWEPNPSQTYHWDVGSGHQYDGANTNVDETQWHTYGVYWTATSSPVFYVDGLITYAPGGPAEGFLMQALLILTSSPNRDDHYSGCPLADWEVDYVRVYDTPPDQPEVPGHLTLNKPATASSIENSGLGPDKAVDGLDTSRWASEWSDNQWVRVDMGASYTINEARVYWQYASAREYKIQVADGPNGPWTDCTHITNNFNNEAWKVHTFAPQTGRYVRLLCIQRNTQWGYSVFEFEVYGNASPIYPFDNDGDGDIDMTDFAEFRGCLTSPDAGVGLSQACQNQDADGDGDVDLKDFAAMQRLFTN